MVATDKKDPIFRFLRGKTYIDIDFDAFGCFIFVLPITKIDGKRYSYKSLDLSCCSKPKSLVYKQDGFQFLYFVWLSPYTHNFHFFTSSPYVFRSIPW